MVTGSLPPMPCGVGDYAAGVVEGLAKQRDVEVGVLTSAAASGGTRLTVVLPPGESVR